MIHRSFLNRDQIDMGGAVGALGELTLSWTLGEGDREMNIYIISLFIYYIYYIVYIYMYMDTYICIYDLHRQHIDSFADGWKYV